MYETVFITLGTECNFTCRYCLQNDNIVKYISKVELSAKTYNFLVENTAKLRQKYGESAKTRVQLWGGEPLLYWDSIIGIVEKLEQICMFGIITNGSLITKDKVEFLNRHNIALAISHDGPNNKMTRLSDVLNNEEILENFLKIDTHGISAVMSAYNQDYYQIWDWFDEKFVKYGKKVPINVDLIMDTWNMPDDMVKFDITKYSEMLDKVMENAYIALLKNDMQSREHQLVRPFINRLSNILKSDEDNTEWLKHPKCGAAMNTANIDLDGNFYLCHNSSELLGTVDDSKEVILEQFQKYNKFIASKECQGCDLLGVCAGGCILIKEGLPHQRYCELQQIFYGKILELIIKFK